ncbi:hypothetical protein IP87_04245 [beta proteobacterium AAP121]|nr:hypothetical protein IP80_05450 [beta proteobacterium AAP65]KPF99870.1 hypothetical protein IP87_04245 [beta proteobacterium AAP121]
MFSASLLGLSLALLLALAAPAAHAQWKWRDKSGQINASDRPPPLDVPEKDIISRPPQETRRTVLSAPGAAASAASAPVAARPPVGDRDLEARRRAAEQEQAGRSKAEEERLATQRAENCRRARGHVAALESGQRMARVNEKGEREVLDDRARADEMRQSRAIIATDCR